MIIPIIIGIIILWLSFLTFFVWSRWKFSDKEDFHLYKDEEEE